MRLQYLCQTLAPLILCGTVCAVEPAAEKQPAHYFPTPARVEFVNSCMTKASDKLAALYQCACAIDRIADAMTYEEFVEASTFARYATLPGEGGGEFRDFDTARQQAKQYRELERVSLQACGMKS